MDSSFSANMFKLVVMLLREHSGGDALQLRRFEPQEVHFKERVSAARLFGYTFVKSNPFLAIVPGFVNAKASRGGGGGLSYHRKDKYMHM